MECNSFDHPNWSLFDYFQNLGYRVKEGRNYDIWVKEKGIGN
jgi:hypothetical protein